MDKREARQFIYANPPFDPLLSERRPSFLGRLFSRSRTSSFSEESNMSGGMQRRGSIDIPDPTTLAQKMQELKNKQAANNEQKVLNVTSIFT